MAGADRPAEVLGAMQQRIDELAAENQRLVEENGRLAAQLDRYLNPPEFAFEEQRIVEYLARSGLPLDLATIGYKLKMRPTRVAFFVERLRSAGLVSIDTAGHGQTSLVMLEQAGRDRAVRNGAV